MRTCGFVVFTITAAVMGCGSGHPKNIGPSNVTQEGGASGQGSSSSSSSSSTSSTDDTGIDASRTTPPTGDKLVITSLTPDKGDHEGGTYVVLKGARFIKDGPRQLKIYFGNMQGTVVRFQSDSEVIVQAPAGKLGDTVDILAVFDPGGQLKLPKVFTYVDRGNDPSVDDLDKKR